MNNTYLELIGNQNLKGNGWRQKMFVFMLMMSEARNTFSIPNNSYIPDLLSTANLKHIVIMLIKTIGDVQKTRLYALTNTI